jgi:hypothetical protein
MPSKSKRHPVYLRVVISKEMRSDLTSMAAKKNVPVAELVRNLLAASLTDDAASRGQVAVRQAVRAEVRLELKRVADRLGSLGAKAVIAAATVEQLMVDLMERAASSGSTSEERKRMTGILHEDARKKAVMKLKKSIAEDDYEIDNP